MFIQPNYISKYPIQSSNVSFEPQRANSQNIDVRSLKTDTVSFTGGLNKYLNPAVKIQSKIFEQELLKLIKGKMSLEDNLGNLIHCMYPDFRFDVKDIKQVKHLDIIKNPPIIFSKNIFKEYEPKTDLFVNFEKLKKIRAEQDFAPYEAERDCQEIVKNVSQNQEFNFISKLCNEFSAQLSQTPNINESSVNKIIKNINSKYNLDANINASEYVPVNNSGKRFDALHSNCSSMGRFDEIYSIMNINFDRATNDLIVEIPHEYVHSLNANSIAYNYNDLKLYRNFERHKYIQLINDFQDSIKETVINHPQFLRQDTKQRKIAYDKMLKTILDKSKLYEKKDGIEVLKNHAKDEAFAYSKTFNWEQIANKKGVNTYIGVVYRDMVNYFDSILYNSEKLNALIS